MARKYCTIYVVRHGQATHNVEKIVGGILDTELTEMGKEQAKAQAKNLSPIKFDAVFSSDLLRAQRTAEIIAADRELAVNTTKLLRERNFGEWEGKREADFRETNKHLIEKLGKLSEQEKQDAKFGDGFESNTEISSRFLNFLREIAITYIGKTILTVSHGSMMRALLMRLGYSTYDELPSGSVENTGYFVLESDGVDFFVKETFAVNKVKS